MELHTNLATDWFESHIDPLGYFEVIELDPEVLAIATIALYWLAG